jgi:hypothetical protein
LVLVIVVNVLMVVGIVTVFPLMFIIPSLPIMLSILAVRERMETFGKMKD